MVKSFIKRIRMERGYTIAPCVCGGTAEVEASLDSEGDLQFVVRCFDCGDGRIGYFGRSAKKCSLRAMRKKRRHVISVWNATQLAHQEQSEFTRNAARMIEEVAKENQS